MSDLVGKTIYLKITDKKGRSRIESREAWNVERFVKSVTKGYAEEKDSSCKVELSTKEEYFKDLKRT